MRPRRTFATRPETALPLRLSWISLQAQGFLVLQQAGQASHTAPEWAHDVVLDARPPSTYARAFVRHHLVAHRLFHLVDVVGMVAVRLTGDGLLRSRAPLAMSLSRIDSLVALRVGDASDQWAPHFSAGAVDAAYGAGVMGVLTLQWGVSHRDAEPIGLWATFDARHYRQALETMQGEISFAGTPVLVGTDDRLDRSGELGRRQSPRSSRQLFGGDSQSRRG